MLITVPVFSPDLVSGFSLVFGCNEFAENIARIQAFLPFIWRVALYAFCVFTGLPDGLVVKFAWNMHYVQEF